MVRADRVLGFGGLPEELRLAREKGSNCGRVAGDPRLDQLSSDLSQ
jgi:hypothetical protein